MKQSKPRYRYITPASSKKRKKKFFFDTPSNDPFFQPTVNIPGMESLNDKGCSLPEETNYFFSSRMGYNFNHVQIHTGNSASESAGDLQARAFTKANHIVFNKNQYDPSSTEGKKLLAHELVHVVQQQQEGERIDRKSLKEETEKTYSVKIIKGDKDWADPEIQLLLNALKKLNKKEIVAVNGYEFVRWSTVTVRKATDKTYIPHAGPEENCYHELGLTSGINRITAYDACFGDPEATGQLEYGLAPGEFRLLHEIGHLMQNAEMRSTFLKALKEGDDQAGAARDALKIQDQSVNKFKDITKKDKPYYAADPDIHEQFAEAYAIYKANPSLLEKKNKTLYLWFKKNEHLGK